MTENLPTELRLRPHHLIFRSGRGVTHYRHLFHKVLQAPACSVVLSEGAGKLETTEETSQVTCLKCHALIAFWKSPLEFCGTALWSEQPDSDGKFSVVYVNENGALTTVVMRKVPGSNPEQRLLSSAEEIDA